MALFYVGYLIIVSSTVAFILAILTPRWIYPVDPATVGSTSTAVNDSSYRGIFYVDAGYPNGTCRDWILLPKDSIAPCRPSTYLSTPRLELFQPFRSSSSLCGGLCRIIYHWFSSVDHPSLVSGWLSVRSSSPSCASLRFSDRCIDNAHL